MKNSNKKKSFTLQGSFKNIRGTSIGDSKRCKEMWFNNNMSKDFICIQEAKAKSFDQISHWLPFSWHDNIRTNFFEDDGHAHGVCSQLLIPTLASKL